jgi:uncharacterized protein (DUF58 family)
MASGNSGGGRQNVSFNPFTATRFGFMRKDLEPVQLDETLRARRPLYIAAVLLLLGSLVLQQPVLFVCALLVATVAVLPEIWYRFGLRALVAEHRLGASRAVFGDTVEVSLVLENRKLLPVPWIEVDDQFPDALPVLGLLLEPSAIPERATLRNTMALWAYQRVRRRYRVVAVARGTYTFGPLDLHLTDPFGILTRDDRREATSALLVYPLLAPIERFGLAARAPFGERATPQRLLEDPLRVGGTRAYMPGDEPRRIHWKATARTGSLQSKIYEPSARHTISIFLDLRTFKHVSYGYTPELVELAISAAASVARWALDQGYAVGLISNGTLSTADQEPASSAVNLRLRVPPSSRPEQLSLILDGLARLYPYYGAPVEKMVASEQDSLPAGATVVYIGNESVLDVPAILALRQLRSRGHAVSLLLTTQDERDGARQGADSNHHQQERPEDHLVHLADLPIHYLGGIATWEALTAEVLGPGRLRRASASLDTRLATVEQQARMQSIHIDGHTSAERTSNGSADDRAGTDRRPTEPRAFILE